VPGRIAHRADALSPAAGAESSADEPVFALDVSIQGGMNPQFNLLGDLQSGISACLSLHFPTTLSVVRYFAGPAWLVLYLGRISGGKKSASHATLCATRGPTPTQKALFAARSLGPEPDRQSARAAPGPIQGELHQDLSVGLQFLFTLPAATDRLPQPKQRAVFCVSVGEGTHHGTACH